jgi:hypothetical protein
MAAIYCTRRLSRKQTIEVGTIVNAVLSSAGVVAGALLVASAFFDGVRQAISDIELYIVISGLVVLGVSIQALARDVFDRRDGSDKNS